MTNRIYLELKYKDAQIIKHALQEYVKRSDVKNETDIEEELGVLNRIEEEYTYDVKQYVDYKH